MWNIHARLHPPEYGSQEYKNQVETIFKIISTTDCIIDELPRFLLPFIMDMEYHRAAICEAEKRLKREHFNEEEKGGLQ